MFALRLIYPPQRFPTITQITPEAKPIVNSPIVSTAHSTQPNPLTPHNLVTKSYAFLRIVASAITLPYEALRSRIAATVADFRAVVTFLRRRCLRLTAYTLAVAYILTSCEFSYKDGVQESVWRPSDVPTLILHYMAKLLSPEQPSQKPIHQSVSAPKHVSVPKPSAMALTVATYLQLDPSTPEPVLYQVLADLSGEPVTVTTQANDALVVVKARAQHFLQSNWTFPFPSATPPAFFAALNPQDDQVLMDTIGDVIENGGGVFHFPLESGLRAKGTIRARRTGAVTCFDYTLTLTRGTFAQTIRAEACRASAADPFIVTPLVPTK